MDPTKKAKKHDAPTQKKNTSTNSGPSTPRRPSNQQFYTNKKTITITESPFQSSKPPSAFREADRVNGLLDQIRSSLLELELGTFDWDGMAAGFAGWEMDGKGVILTVWGEGDS